MGTALTGLGVGSTYNGLLKTTDNAVLGGTLRVITDGFGNNSALQVSTAGVASSGTLSVTGASTLAALSATTGAFSSTLSVAGAISGAGFTALFSSPPAIGGTSPAAGAFTTLSATAAIGELAVTSSTGTNRVLSRYTNTGGVYLFGAEDSVGGSFGATAYDGAIAVPSGKGFSVVVTGSGAIQRTTSTGLTVAGLISATGNLICSGSTGGTHTSRLVADQLTSARSRIMSWGPDASTAGRLEILALSADGSTNVTSGIFSSTGLAVTGTGAFSGALSAASLTLTSALAVAQGGTGATSASAARTALGLAIGSDVQAYSSVLSTYAGINPSANVQTLLGSANFAACRTNLGLVIGTDVQAYDADLSALAALSGTNTIYYRSASNTWSAVTIGSNLTFSGGTLSAASGGGGTIGGSTGATDNRLIRADGTGGSTVQSSGITIDDSDNVTGAATMDVGTGGYKVSGTKVLGAQQAAESDIALLTAIGGFDQVDATDIATNFSGLNNKINSILAKLRAHGIIAT